MSFHGYDPKLARWGFSVAAAACAVLGAAALANARAGAERLGTVRGGVAVGLMLAFGYASARLRPRDGWGVTLTPLALVIARPFSKGPPLEVAWNHVERVRREGRSRALVVFLTDGGRFLLSPFLFPDSRSIGALAEAIGQLKSEGKTIH